MRRRSRVDRRASEGGVDVHRPLLARGDHRVGKRTAQDPSAARPAAAHRRAAAGADAAPTALPRMHEPRDGEARRREYGVGPMVLGFGGPEMIGEMRRMFDEERGDPRPRRSVCRPGNINDEFVALCPSFLMEDRDRGARASAPVRCGSSPRRSPIGPPPTVSHRRAEPTRSTTSRS